MDEYWPLLARAMGLEELAKATRFAITKNRRENYKELIELLDKTFATRTLQEWLDIFEKQKLHEAGFSYSPIFTHADVVNDPQALENNYIIDATVPAVGKIKMAGYPISFSSTPAKMKCSAPEFGQHSEEVLIELLGYDWEKIAELKDEKVI